MKKKKQSVFIKSWRDAWKWLSIQAAAIGASMSLGYATMYPQLKDTIPPRWMAGVTASVFALGILGRLVKQK